MTGAHEGGRPTPPGTGRARGSDRSVGPWGPEGLGARGAGCSEPTAPGVGQAPTRCRRKPPAQKGQVRSLSSPREQDPQRWSGRDRLPAPRAWSASPGFSPQGGFGGDRGRALGPAGSGCPGHTRPGRRPAGLRGNALPPDGQASHEEAECGFPCSYLLNF